jgi:transforming growth factor-beta-induced protein
MNIRHDIKRSFKTVFFAVTAMFAISNAFAQTPTPAPTNPPAPESDIVETLTSHGVYTTLLGLLDKAGLTKDWKAKGPLTVFVANDETFAKVPKETMDKWNSDKKLLKSALQYMQAEGALKVADLTKLAESTPDGADLPTAAGTPLKLTMQMPSNHLQVNDEDITKPDGVASNGIIHEVEAVLMMPEASPSPSPARRRH